MASQGQATKHGAERALLVLTRDRRGAVADGHEEGEERHEVRVEVGVHPTRGQRQRTRRAEQRADGLVAAVRSFSDVPSSKFG